MKISNKINIMNDLNINLMLNNYENNVIGQDEYIIIIMHMINVITRFKYIIYW